MGKHPTERNTYTRAKQTLFVSQGVLTSKEHTMTTTQAKSPAASTTQGERRWSYTSGISDTPLLGLTIGDMLDETVAKYPDNPALISRHQKIRLSYRELQAQVNQCAKGFMQMGVQKGQRV